MIDHNSVILGVDCGGTNLRVGLVGSDYRVSNTRVYESQRILIGDSPMDRLADLLERYLSECLTDGQELIAVSTGFPSMVAADRKTIIRTTFAPALNDIDVTQVLSRFHVPVYAEKDVNLLLRYDGWRLNLRPQGVWLGVYVGTGLGCSLAVDGKILEGVHGVTGELGHIPVGTGLRCGCGNEGCVETKTAGNALVRELKARYGSDEPIRDTFLRHTQEPFIDEWLEYLAIAMATAINLLDPAAVIVAGGVPQMAGFPKERLLQKIHRMARKPVPDSDLSLMYPSVNPEDGIIGAAMYAAERAGNPRVRSTSAVALS